MSDALRASPLPDGRRRLDLSEAVGCVADHGWQQVAKGVRGHDGGSAGDARKTGGLELRASVQSLELGRPNLTVSMRRGDSTSSTQRGSRGATGLSPRLHRLFNPMPIWTSPIFCLRL